MRLKLIFGVHDRHAFVALVLADHIHVGHQCFERRVILSHRQKLSKPFDAVGTQVRFIDKLGYALRCAVECQQAIKATFNHRHAPVVFSQALLIRQRNAVEADQPGMVDTPRRDASSGGHNAVKLRHAKVWPQLGHAPFRGCIQHPAIHHHDTFESAWRDGVDAQWC